MSPIWGVVLVALHFSQLVNGHCLGCKVDVCFAVDQSLYGNEVVWNSVRTMIKTVIYMMDIGPNATQVGIFKFAGLVHTEFYLDDYNDVSDVLSAVNGRSSGLGVVRTDCFGAGHGKRIGVPKLAIMVTDGKYTDGGDDVASAATAVRNDNIILLVVGVATPNDSMINVIANNDAANTFLVGTTYTYASVVTAIFDRFKDICAIFPVGRDCNDVPGGSGRLHINIGNQGETPVYQEVLCDNWWMVLIKRQDGSVNFNRTWADYKNGFGQLYGEFWAGLELMYRVTNNGRNYKLRIDFQIYNGSQYYAEYESFSVESEGNYYKLRVSGYDPSSTLGDSQGLSYHNGMFFSTRDQDHDTSGHDCAHAYSSGWWFGDCHHVKLTGQYGQYDDVHEWEGIQWSDPFGSHTFAKRTSMMISKV